MMGTTRFRPLLAVLAMVTAGEAHEDRPPYRATNVEVVGHTATGTTLSDVWVHRSYVYLGSRTCGDGVSIVDARVPEHPLVLGRLPADSQSTYEDVVVISVRTPHFQGDLLAVGVQPCSPQGAKRGVHLWDVSDPAKPEELAFYVTGQRSAVHELDARQIGEKALLFLAVPYSERFNEGGDFRIVDATDPRRPVQLSNWGVYSKLGLVDANLRVLGRPVVYCHSVKVSEDGRYAFLSYWDAGYIALDISNPAEPVFLSRIEYRMPEEGNAHSTFPVMHRNLLFAADEDYLIGGIQVTIETPQPAALAASELPFAKPGCSLESNEFEVVPAGQGCGGALPDLSGKIAAFEPGGACSYYARALVAQRAGAAGFLVTRTDGAIAGSGADAITIGGALISPADYDRLQSTGIVRARIAASVDDTWGYLRIFDIADLKAPRQIGTFTTPNTKRCPVQDDGWYTVHNPVVVGNRAYMSWYSDGLRVADVSDPTKPVEVASFVITGQGSVAARTPSRSADHIEHERGEGDPESFVWGVVVDEGGLVYLSDEMTGLWIVRLQENGQSGASSRRPRGR